MPAEPDRDALRRLGPARGAETLARDPDRGVDCFYVYPTVSDQQTRLATKRVDPELRSIALYQAARFSQAVPGLRARVPPGDGAGAAGGDDDARRLPDGVRRRRGRVRRVPAADRAAPRLRPARPLAGHLPPAAARPAAHRREPPAAPAARVRRPAGRRRHGAQGLRPRRHVPPGPHVRAAGRSCACVLAFSTFNATPPEQAIFGRGASRVAASSGCPTARGWRPRARTRPRSAAAGRPGWARSS